MFSNLFRCDNCGIETNGITYVNGMKFCAKCYQETFGKDNQQNEIQQLKHQLAEKQNTIDEINKEFVQAVHDWKTLCAEKDKEIELLKHLGKHETTVEMFKENAKLIIEKRQFAIQELEKVKILLQNATNYEGYNVVGIYDAVNNQIKELKGE